MSTSGRPSGGAAARPPAWLDKAANARYQLVFVEWLGDVEVGALLQAPPLAARCVLAADQDDRDIAALLHLLELAADLEAVLLGQDDVEDDALWSLLQHLL